MENKKYFVSYYYTIGDKEGIGNAIVVRDEKTVENFLKSLHKEIMLDVKAEDVMIINIIPFKILE